MNDNNSCTPSDCLQGSKVRDMSKYLSVLRLRLSTLESSQDYHYTEIVRRLDALSDDFKEIKKDLKENNDKQSDLITRMALAERNIASVKAKVNRNLSILGTIIITVVTAGATIISKKFIP